MTLEDIIKQQETQETTTSLETVSRLIKASDDKNAKAITDVLGKLVAGMNQLAEGTKEMKACLERIEKKEMPAPIVNLPAPVVNVKAPIVNVPAPVVNVPRQEVSHDPRMDDVLSKLNDLLIREPEEVEPAEGEPKGKTIIRATKKQRFFPTPLTGTVDGVNATFYGSFAPRKDQDIIFVNGQFQVPDVDITITGNKIVFVTPPVAGDKVYMLSLK